MHIASLYLWNHKPYKISAWPTVVDVHITRKDTDFNCSQSLTCVEREFKRTYDLKIYSSVVILCKTNTASSFGPAIAWKWRQIFSETSVTFTIRRGATSKKTWVFIYTAVKNPTLAAYLLLPSFLWDITQLILVVVYRCFEAACRSHFQGSNSPRRISQCIFSLWFVAT